MRWLMSNPFDVRFRAPSRGRWACVGTVAAGCALLGACGFLRPSELRAGTDLLPTLGSHASGAVSFVQRADGVQVTYDLYGLAPGSLHALHLHEQGNCNARDASSAGPIFNPDAGRLKRGARPDGALGDVRADSNGNASGFIVADDRVAYAEHVAGGYVFSDSETVSSLLRLFDSLRCECLKVSESTALIERLGEQWDSGASPRIQTPTAGTV